MLEGDNLNDVQNIVYHLVKAQTEFNSLVKRNSDINSQQISNFTSGIQLAQLTLEQFSKQIREHMSNMPVQKG